MGVNGVTSPPHRKECLREGISRKVTLDPTPAKTEEASHWGIREQARQWERQEVGSFAGMSQRKKSRVAGLVPTRKGRGEVCDGPPRPWQVAGRSQWPPPSPTPADLACGISERDIRTRH